MMTQQSPFMGPWLISILRIFPCPQKDLVSLLEGMSWTARVQGLPGVSAFLQSCFLTDPPSAAPGIPQYGNLHRSNLGFSVTSLISFPTSWPWLGLQSSRNEGGGEGSVLQHSLQHCMEWNITPWNPVFSPPLPCFLCHQSCHFSNHMGAVQSRQSSSWLFLALRM